MTVVEYVRSGRHLPPPLRDFHDQKDAFKLMHSRQGDFEFNGAAVAWTTGQCYVIDRFLWFMALHGWTLQQSRAKVEFLDLDQGIREMKEESAEQLRQALAERKAVPRA